MDFTNLNVIGCVTFNNLATEYFQKSDNKPVNPFLVCSWLNFCFNVYMLVEFYPLSSESVGASTELNEIDRKQGKAILYN